MPVPRHRHRYDVRLSPYTWTWSAGGNSTHTQSGSGNATAWTNFEEIFDVSRSRATIKPVVHRCVKYTPIEYARHQRALSNNWYSQTMVSGEPIWWLQESFANTVNWHYGPQLPSSGTVAELADKAFDAFFTQVPQEIDIANFVIDLRDLKDLVPQIQENIVKTVSSGFLQWNFGWSPLIGDLQKAHSLLATVRARIAWLKSTYGKRTPLGYESSWTLVHNHPANQAETIFTLESSSATFRAGGYLYHKLERLDGIEGELRALLAATGLTSPGKVIWERIPFSFIVDWVSRVSRFADKLSIQPFSGGWTVSDVSHSYSLRAEYKVTVNPNWDLSPLAGSHVGNLVYERYERGRGLPLSSALFYGRELTPQQLALSAALIGAAS